MSRVEDRKKVRMYTTLEKLMFSKIEGYYTKFKDSMSKYKELEDVEKQVSQLIAHYEVEKDRSVASVFQNFEKYFAEIFQAITLQGKTDVRLKKIN